MTEEQRIESIKANGGCHLQNFAEKNRTYAMCLLAVEMDGNAIDFVPKPFLNKELYMLACKSNGWILCQVPDEYISQDIVECAVSSSGMVIDEVPNKYKTKELYLLAAKNDPKVMQIMPVKYLTVDFVIEVVKSYGDTAISSLPKTHKTNSFYIELVKVLPNLIWTIPKAAHNADLSKTAISSMGYKSTVEAIKDNPELLSQLHTSLYDHETCLAFVKSDFFDEGLAETWFDGNNFVHCYGFNTQHDRENGILYLFQKYSLHYSLKHILRWSDVCEITAGKLPESIRYISEKILTKEMCFAAVKRDHRVFRDVPKGLRTREICLNAFKEEPYHILDFPEDIQTYDLWLDAVRRAGSLMEYVPKNYVDRDLAFAAVQDYGTAIEYIPEDILDEEICLTAIHNNNGGWLSHGILGYVPEELRTYEMCLEAVKRSNASRNYGFVPKQHRTYELCLTAAQHGCEITNVPEDYYTEELCLNMLGYHASGFNCIPKSKLTEKICLKAIALGHRGGTILADIPDELLTQEMCDKSVRVSIWSLKDVPDRFVTEEILLYVAEEAPGRLSDNFPDRFKTKEFIEKIISQTPHAEFYVKKYLPKS